MLADPESDIAHSMLGELSFNILPVLSFIVIEKMFQEHFFVWTAINI